MADQQSDDTQPSRGRDHMANERTYLAWLRTAIQVMVVGLAFVQFAGSDGALAAAAGALLVAVGAAGLVFGTVRYRTTNAEIERGRYETGSSGRAATAAALVLLTAVIVALVLLLLGGTGG